MIAIDGEPEAIDSLVALAGGESPQLETRVARFEDETWPACDLVNASYALPLAHPEAFDALWTRIVDSLRPGGRFSGQLFGVNDDWARSGVVVKSRAEVEAMLAPFEIERLQEFDGEDTTAIGSRKHWHVFHVVARKR